MFKQLSQSVIEKMKEDGRIMLTVKRGWETATSTNPIPYKINLFIDNQLEHLFNCYLQIYDSAVIISDIIPTPYVSHQKNLIDGYLYIAIDGLVKFAKRQKKKRVVVDTNISCAADHLPHYGFKLFTEEDFPTKSIKGMLTL